MNQAALSPTEMRHQSTNISAIFTKYSQNYSENPNNIHCFFEGEDNKYYSYRIANYTNYHINETCNYDCNGRDGVTKLLKKIVTCKSWNKDKHLFFIDRDYGLDSYHSTCEVYQTPYYSIENFYTHIEAFKQILNVELSLNAIDNDYKLALSDYERTHKEFQKLVLPINLWNRYQKRRDMKIKFTNQDMFMFFGKIKIEEIEVKTDITFKNIANYHINKISRAKDLDESEKEKRISLLKDSDFTILNEELTNATHELSNQISRGKYELFYLESILIDLAYKVKHSLYFSKEIKHYKKWSAHEIITVFSSHAYTPECLITYLNNFQQVK